MNCWTILRRNLSFHQGLVIKQQQPPHPTSQLLRNHNPTEVKVCKLFPLVFFSIIFKKNIFRVPASFFHTPLGNILHLLLNAYSLYQPLIFPLRTQSHVKVAFIWKPVSEMNWRVMLNLELTCYFQVKDRCMCATKIDVTNFFDLNTVPKKKLGWWN